MNIEFHYYIIYILAKKAGFSEYDSHIVAYSSQYIDNNLIAYKIRNEKAFYETIATQNYGWWSDHFPKNVYMPFHFFPGDQDYPGCFRKDRKTNPLNCTPGSDRVKELLVHGLKTRNLYRVGIALHTYADSWAHQNFSAYNQEWNMLSPSSVIPPIGHAHAIGSPDKVGEVWEDPRLENPRVNNTDRFLEAARMIYKYLCTYNRRGFDDHSFVVDDLAELIRGSGYGTTREERIANYVIDEDIIPYNKYEWISDAVYIDFNPSDADGFVGYDKLRWLKDSLLYTSNMSEKQVLEAKEDFFDSHWFKWMEAAKEHVAAGQRILKDLV